MPNSAAKLKLGINSDMIDKNVSGNVSLYSSGWENVEFSPDELVQSIKRGVAYCPQLSGSRRTNNFYACDIASVDVDHGMSIEGALAQPIVRSAGLFIYTTVRHTPDAHRYRVVFRLPETVTKASRMVAVTQSLTRKLGGDQAAVDATRICFGNRGAEIHHIGHEISKELLAEILADTAPSDDAILSAAEVATRRSLIALDPCQELRLADGRTMCILDVPLRTAVHCPCHHDTRASAFVLEGRNGGRGVYCSACRKTYWAGPTAAEYYDFEDFVKTARKVAAKARPLPKGEAGGHPLRQEFFSECRVHFVQDNPVPKTLFPGVTFIRSPKGSGKTEGLIPLIALERNALLIGHRRTLIRGTTKRLGLSCYLDKANVPKLNRAKYGICLDSLLQIRPDYGYGLVVVDESEQVLAHLLSRTITERGDESRIFKVLTEIVRRADHVILLDADLGYLSFNTFARMVSDKDEHGVWRPNKSLHLWINDDASNGA